jgi:hypothetical protein
MMPRSPGAGTMRIRARGYGEFSEVDGHRTGSPLDPGKDLLLRQIERAGSEIDLQRCAADIDFLCGNDLLVPVWRMVRRLCASDEIKCAENR